MGDVAAVILSTSHDQRRAEAGAATKAIRSYTSILSPRPARALCLSLSLDPGLGTSVPLRACERKACVLRAPCALRVRVMRGLLIEQREGGRHTCHGSSPSNPKHPYFTEKKKK